MELIEPKVYVEEYDGKQIMKRIERACRICYRSEDKMTDTSYQNLLKNCINRGHESVIEHEKISVLLVGDIGTYKDLTRHRIASFSVESTRYCNYGKDKFGNELKFMKPVHITEGTEEYKIWEECMKNIEKSYIQMSKLGALPDQLRMLLPHSTASQYVLTANIREWRHILSLRCSSHTHPAIRQLLIPLLLKFKKDMPELFEGVEYDTEFPKEKYAKILKYELN